MGFRVARLPFADHPVRNPVNVGKYSEPSGEQVVLLGKYPYHFALPDGPNPQRELQKRFDALSDELEAWRGRPSDVAFERGPEGVRGGWGGVGRGAAGPDPTVGGGGAGGRLCDTNPCARTECGGVRGGRGL